MKKNRLFEVIALAVAGACLTVYGYILGYAHQKADDKSVEGVEIGEDKVAEHISDVISHTDCEPADGIEITEF